MKKYLVIVLLLFSSFVYSQISPSSLRRVTNASTTFQVNIPKGDVIQNLATGETWYVTASIASTESINSASASLEKFAKQTDVSLLVPYTGATTDLDLGANNLKLSGEVIGRGDTIYHGVAKILSGTSEDKHDIFLTTSGGNVYFEVEKTGGGDVEYIFGKGSEFDLDCTTGAGVGGRARVQLTEGTTTNPIMNYVYVTHNNGAAVLNASTSLPTGEFAWVGLALIQSDIEVDDHGAMLFQRTDESHYGTDVRGQLSKIREKLRFIGAEVILDGGIAQTVTITEATPDVIDFSTTTGTVYQLHRNTWAASSASVDGIYVANASGSGTLTQYQKLTDLSDIRETADGTSFANNQRVILTIWGAMNSMGQQKTFVNLPINTYLSDDDAINDIANYAVTTVPNEYQTTAFLIGKLVLKYGNNGQWVNVLGGTSVQDLRGVALGFNVGGATVIDQSFTDGDFELLNTTDPSKTMTFDLSNLTTGANSVLTIQDASGTVAYTSDIPTNNNQLTNGAGYLTTETDPVYSASQASNIDATDITNLSNLSGTNTGDQDLSSYVVGPASSADNEIPRYNTTTGKLLQTSGVYIDDDGKLGVGVADPINTAEFQNNDVADKAIVSVINNGGTNGAAFEMVDVGSSQAYKFKIASTGIFKLTDTFNSKDILVAESNPLDNAITITPTSVVIADLYTLPTTAPTNSYDFMGVDNFETGTLTWKEPSDIITAGTDLSWTGNTLNYTGTGGSGDVSGPASSTDNAIARFDATTGKIIQNSSAYIADNGNLGIGVAVPTESVHMESTGDVTMWLRADTDNSGEDDNPSIKFSQDGTTATQFKFGLNGSADTQFTGALSNSPYLYAATYPIQIGFSGNDIATFTATGVGIFDTAPSVALDVTGDITASGDMTAVDFNLSSDIRLKKNINCYKPEYLDIEYKEYQFKSDLKNRNRVGVIAQELQKVKPEFVQMSEDSTLVVSYIDLHNAEIAYLKDKTKQLEQRIDELEDCPTSSSMKFWVIFGSVWIMFLIIVIGTKK